jgi:hypothetical protein
MHEVSRGSHGKESVLFYQGRVRVTGGSRDDIHAWPESLRSQRVY